MAHSFVRSFHIGIPALAYPEYFNSNLKRFSTEIEIRVDLYPFTLEPSRINIRQTSLSWSSIAGNFNMIAEILWSMNIHEVFQGRFSVAYSVTISDIGLLSHVLHEVICQEGIGCDGKGRYYMCLGSDREGLPSWIMWTFLEGRANRI
jgi:hypothetical protein